MTMTLDGQVAIVTGGARGQGRSHAIALAGLGARVVVSDVPEPMSFLHPRLGSLAGV
jgi:NAD(P)-dependent dehydrogenase (short-subunit alcohol dehydrogenase family)